MTPSLTRRPPWTVQVASFSAAHRWPVITLWFVATIGIFLVSLAAGGTDAENAVQEDSAPEYESGRAYDVFNASGTTDDPSQDLLIVISSGTGTVDDDVNATAVGDIVSRATALTSTVAGAVVPTFDQVIDPLQAPPEAGLVSPDRTTVRVVARMPGEREVVEERLVPVPAFLDTLRESHPDLRIHGLSGILANDDIETLVNDDLDNSLRITIPLTFVILLLAFGAAVAAFVPLILAVTSLLAAFGVLALYSQFVSPVSPYASQLVVLIGLAVAVDYSLFMITRFRTERRRREKLAAISTASSTAGRAVFFSGLAVMISIGGLFLLDDPLFRSMAIGTISVVFISVVGSLTFLPALLSILDQNVNRFRLPFLGRQREEGSGPWSRVVRATMRRPLLSFVVSAGFLLLLASPVLRLHIGQGDFASFPDSIEGVQAINLMNEKWPEGSTLQFQVVVTKADEPATQEAIGRLSDELVARDGLSGPVESRPSQDGTVTLVSVVMSGGQNDLANRAIVRDVREEVVPRIFGGLSGVEALVTGDAAFTADVVGFYEDGMGQVLVFVLGFSFLLLLVAFHSIVIPIKAIILNLLSTGAAYGLLVLVFQEGWGADFLNVKPGVIESFIPIFIFTILFGLSMDYHVFILTRIKEARDRGLSSDAAVERGISITAGTVTSAAVIMVAVFAVFVTLELAIIKQLGFGLAVAVFLDATLIRSVLLPASMKLLGDWNWWMPRFLSWIPRVTIEGESDEPELEGPSDPAPAPAGTV
ncbi:MAG: anti-sigma-factor antagonist [Chloroflexota bacterium]|nr:anti-sigma-factor antagonist [Chloroflexota bacterium]